MLAHIESRGRQIPIVFVHGSGFSKEVFYRQFESDRLRGHHLIALDLPGHGDSEDAADPAATYSYRGLARSILDFLDQKKLGRCVVAGWSLGGHAALELLHEPDRVAGVMAFGAPPASNGPLGILRSMHFCRLLLLAGKARLSDAEARYFERVCVPAAETGKYIAGLQRTDTRMRPGISRSLMERKGASQKQLVETAIVPVCLLHGAKDILVRTNYMKGIRGPTLAHGGTVIYPDCGHAPFLEQPERFNELLHEFAVSAAAATPQQPAVREAVNA